MQCFDCGLEKENKELMEKKWLVRYELNVLTDYPVDFEVDIL